MSHGVIVYSYQPIVVYLLSKLFFIIARTSIYICTICSVCMYVDIIKIIDICSNILVKISKSISSKHSVYLYFFNGEASVIITVFLLRFCAWVDFFTARVLLCSQEIGASPRIDDRIVAHVLAINAWCAVFTETLEE